MSMTQRWVMGIVVVLLVIVGFVANALFLQTNTQLKRAQAEIAELKKPATTEPKPEDTAGEKNMLARVAELLPPETNVVHTLALENDLVLLGTVPNFDGGSEQSTLTLWIADPSNNKLTELAHHDTTGPGVSTSFDTHDYPPLVSVHVLEQWEGDDLRVTDYISPASGTIQLTQTYHAGQIIDLERNGKKLSLQLAPKDACADNVSGPAKHVSVTGLLANGVEVKLNKPVQVTCLPNEEFGMGFYPTMEEADFDGQATAQGELHADLRLPFGPTFAFIDVNKMDASGVQLVTQ